MVSRRILEGKVHEKIVALAEHTVEQAEFSMFGKSRALADFASRGCRRVQIFLRLPTLWPYLQASIGELIPNSDEGVWRR